MNFLKTNNTFSSLISVHSSTSHLSKNSQTKKLQTKAISPSAPLLRIYGEPIQSQGANNHPDVHRKLNAILVTKKYLHMLPPTWLANFQVQLVRGNILVVWKRKNPSNECKQNPMSSVV